jgi:hypothetical protein
MTVTGMPCEPNAEAVVVRIVDYPRYLPSALLRTIP